MADDFDIVIVGGGPVGASLACALEPTGLRVAVVEAREGSRAGSDDTRALALAWSTRRIFDAIGAWEGMAGEAQAVRTIHVSERGRFGSVRLEASEQGVDALGYVVPAHAVDAALERRLGDSPARRLRPAVLRTMSVGEDAVDLRVDEDGTERRLRARLVVGADGAASPVRAHAGIAAERLDYGQSAVITQVRAERPRPAVAYERFDEAGPLALLPRGDDRWAVVWTLPGDEAARVVALDDDAFIARLQRQFGHRLGRLSEPAERRAYPLSLVRAQEAVRPRVAVVGNAAHTVHPVAAQGFNLGLRDAAWLAEAIAGEMDRGGDPGRAAALRRYADWRRRDQGRVLFLTDTLARLFTNPWTPARAARRCAMTALELAPPLRRAFARQTMGISGRPPRLVARRR